MSAHTYMQVVQDYGMDHHRFMGANWCVIATFPVAHPHQPSLLEALKLAKAMFLLTLAYLI